MKTTPQAIPSREYWPVYTLENTLEQIRLCTNARLVDQGIALQLCDNLHELINTIGNFAHTGMKISEDVSASSDFDLFLNQMIYTNNTILVRSDETDVVFTTLDNPNYYIATTLC